MLFRSATPEVDPLQETLPAGHWGIQDGVKTWKDLDDRYRAGSTEVRKWQQEAETKARLVEGYQELIARMEHGRIAAPAPAAKPAFDLASWQKLTAVDPARAIAEAAAYGLTQDPRLAEQILAPHLKPFQEAQQQFAKQSFDAKIRQNFSDLENRYPEAAPGTPQHNTAAEWLGENPWVRDVAQVYPKTNAPEIIFKLANYDALAQRLAAAEGKMTATRAKAVVARPAGNGRATPADANTHRGLVEAAAEDARAAGVDVPPWILDGMTASLERNMT